MGPTCLEPWPANEVWVVQVPKVICSRRLYQLLLGPTECPLNSNTIFLKKKIHLLFSSNSCISFACYNLVSRNVLGDTLSCLVRGTHFCGLLLPSPSCLSCPAPLTCSNQSCWAPCLTPLLLAPTAAGSSVSRGAGTQNTGLMTLVAGAPSPRVLSFPC